MVPRGCALASGGPPAPAQAWLGGRSHLEHGRDAHRHAQLARAARAADGTPPAAMGAAADTRPGGGRRCPTPSTSSTRRPSTRPARSASSRAAPRRLCHGVAARGRGSGARSSMSKLTSLIPMPGPGGIRPRPRRPGRASAGGRTVDGEVARGPVVGGRFLHRCRCGWFSSIEVVSRSDGATPASRRAARTRSVSRLHEVSASPGAGSSAKVKRRTLATSGGAEAAPVAVDLDGGLLAHSADTRTGRGWEGVSPVNRLRCEGSRSTPRHGAPSPRARRECPCS